MNETWGDERPVTGDRRPAAGDMEIRPEIIYIAGYGRSGSTILDILLGNSTAIVGLGEAARFFPMLAGDIESHCICGKTLGCCPFWRGVLGNYEQHGLRDWSKAASVQRQVEGVRGLIALLRGDFLPGGSREVVGHLYRQYVQTLFTSASKVAGSPMVVDSSKTTWNTIGRPLALNRLCRFNVRIVHMIRDGRAVMWAGCKGTNRALTYGPQPVSFWRGYKTTASWALVNLLTLVMRLLFRSNQFVSVTYESLTTKPLLRLSRLSCFLKVDLDEVKEKVESDDRLQVFHHLGGNRAARQSRIHLRVDDEWRVKLPYLCRCVYWLMFWPVALLNILCYRCDR